MHLSFDQQTWNLPPCGLPIHGRNFCRIETEFDIGTGLFCSPSGPLGERTHRTWQRASAAGLDRVGERADALDGHGHRLPGRHRPDARGRAGEQHVPG